MRESNKATRIAVPFGALIFLFALWQLTSVYHVDIWQALVLSFVMAAIMGGGMWVILYQLFSRRSEKIRLANTQKYYSEVAEMYQTAQANIERVRTYAVRIEPNNTATSTNLRKICDHAEIILREIQDKRPDSSRGSIVVVSRNLEVLLEMTLPQYLQMIDPNPVTKQYFPNGESLIQAADNTINHLEQGFCATVQMLEREDINRFEIALKLLDPFDHSLLI